MMCLTYNLSVTSVQHNYWYLYILQMGTTLSQVVRCHHGTRFLNTPVDLGFFGKMTHLANEDLDVRVFVILSLIFFLLSIFSDIA